MRWSQRLTRRHAREATLPSLRYSGRPVAYAPDAWRIPVAVVSYFPAEGDRLDRRVTGDVAGGLSGIRSHTSAATARIIETLETGSVYHGFRDAAALASLRYEVVDSFEFLEPLPIWRKHGHTVPMTDYRAIVQRIGGESLVLERGVKEIWLWGYHGGVIDLWESNMAGPFGDISNSDRDATDLPVFEKTYTFYHYNYGRGASEAVEDHLHQIEAMMRHADEELFWKRFVGRVGEGRCGWSHYPPNGRHDYDWANGAMVETDIEDWRPDGSGRRVRLDADRWGGDSLTWFTYWMQSLPGRNNGLWWQGKALRNWWEFVGAFDETMAAGGGLTH